SHAQSAARPQLTSVGAGAAAVAADNLGLMMPVSLSAPGLVIPPTHRLVSGLPNLTAPELMAALGQHFELTQIGRGPKAAQETWELIEMDGGQDLLGFGTVADGVWQTGRFRSAALTAEL